jgi:hypothetical protein
MIQTIKHEKNWYKKCQLILVFHEEECAKHSSKRNHKWKISDTAKYLSLSVGYVSESLKLAQSDIAIIKTLTRENALKVLKGIS